MIFFALSTQTESEFCSFQCLSLRITWAWYLTALLSVTEMAVTLENQWIGYKILRYVM